VCGLVETWARHFISSVGALTTKDARPPATPARKTLDKLVGDVGVSFKRESVRLYDTNRRPLRAPYVRMGAVAPILQIHSSGKFFLNFILLLLEARKKRVYGIGGYVGLMDMCVSISPLTSVPAFSNCPLKLCRLWSCGCIAAAVVVVVAVASTTCCVDVLPA
jgi:hypothetical protein